MEAKAIHWRVQMHDGYDEEGYECSICGQELERHECQDCEEGYSYHDCGEDTCNCIDPEPNVICDICKGYGSWWYCPACKICIDDDKQVEKDSK